MSLAIIAETLRVGNEDISVQVYSSLSLTYTKIVSVEGLESYEISQDKNSFIVHPSAKKEGGFKALVTTSGGSISIPIYYLSEYEKDSTIVNNGEDYYPHKMFEWDSENPKWGETKAVTEMFKLLYPKEDLIPILTDHLVPYFSDYCSSQLLGISLQFALQQHEAGNSNTLVLYTNSSPSLSNIDDFLGEAPATLEQENSTMFVSAATPQTTTGLASPLPENTGAVVENVIAANSPEYGYHFVPYDSSFSPLKYTEIVSENNEQFCLKYGAKKTAYDTLSYVKFNKVIYVGQSFPLSDDYFSFSGGVDGKGFADESISSPLDTNIGGIWWDGGNSGIELVKWAQIEGVPASLEVIYNKENIDISELTKELIIPSYSRMVIKEEDFISWINKYSKNIQKIAIKFDGKDFIIKIAPDDIYFNFYSDTISGLGFDEGIMI